jgi:hypothetical protein
MILYTACVHQVGDDLTADPQYCSDRSNGYHGWTTRSSDE